MVVSPNSIFPPGRDHRPLLGSRPRCTSTTVSEDGDNTTVDTAARGNGVTDDEDDMAMAVGSLDPRRFGSEPWYLMLVAAVVVVGVTGAAAATAAPVDVVVKAVVKRAAARADTSISMTNRTVLTVDDDDERKAAIIIFVSHNNTRNDRNKIFPW